MEVEEWHGDESAAQDGQRRGEALDDVVGVPGKCGAMVSTVVSTSSLPVLTMALYLLWPYTSYGKYSAMVNT